MRCDVFAMTTHPPGDHHLAGNHHLANDYHLAGNHHLAGDHHLAGNHYLAGDHHLAGDRITEKNLEAIVISLCDCKIWNFCSLSVFAITHYHYGLSMPIPTPFIPVVRCPG